MLSIKPIMFQNLKQFKKKLFLRNFRHSIHLESSYSSLGSLNTNSRIKRSNSKHSSNHGIIPYLNFNSSKIKNYSTDSIKNNSKIVICGGGIIGVSVAYHLAKLGVKNIQVIEQSSLGSGSTWHCMGGIVGTAKNSLSDSALSMYSCKLYNQFAQEGNLEWKECGAFDLAKTKDRMIYFKRIASKLNSFGNLKPSLLTSSEISERMPYLKTEDLEGAMWIPSDGIVNVSQLLNEFVLHSKKLGVQFTENTEVLNVLIKNRKVESIITSSAQIECDIFINCAGMWAHDLGKQGNIKVRVPLHSCGQYTLITGPVDNSNTNAPIVRDYDSYIYLREYNGGVLASGFEPKAKAAFVNKVPQQFNRKFLQEDWDHFQILLEQILNRDLRLDKSKLISLTCSPESFTPDGRPILGRAPEVSNYFIACGMNSNGVSFAGGIGKVMADLVVNGNSGMDLWHADTRRFVDMHNNTKFLKERVTEVSAQVAGIELWDTQMSGMITGRQLRTSPIYPRMEDNAKFGQGSGYERPLYFDDGGSSIIYSSQKKTESTAYDFFEQDSHYQSSFYKPKWFEQVRKEYWACRTGVCLIDMSTFSKFEIKSVDDQAVRYLQYLCSNDIDRNIGVVVHTGMQNEMGGYENDCSIVRLAFNRFLMISPTAQQTRSFTWLTDHLPADGSVHLADLTSMYTAINVIGPKAQELLTELTDTPLSKQAFPTMSCQEIDVGQASGVVAMRLTHSGEDGWMLYIPSEYALHVYDTLMATGRNFGIKNSGYYALRALRTEKFFAYWGTDLMPHVTPLECGWEYRVKFDMGNFIGFDSLVQQRNQGVRKRLVQFLLVGHDVEQDIWPWGGESIYRNGIFAGRVTSTAYGFTLTRHVCLGYIYDLDSEFPSEDSSLEKHARVINNDFIMDRDAYYEIDIAGSRFAARPFIYPPKLPAARTSIHE